eukprot:gene12278-13720_t
MAQLSVLQCDRARAQDFQAEQQYTLNGAAGGVLLMSVEVINLNRNVLITGDDFRRTRPRPA